jgi:GntR family transcriptional regulator, rspAB operon transcriptional repressor
MSMLAARPIALSERRNTISVRVYERLREAIVTTEFKPGARISEADLGQSLSVSRTPVREAFVRLFEEELIEISPQTGTRVSLIDPERVRQGIFVRSSVECAAIRTHYSTPSRQQYRDLEFTIEAQERAIADGDITAMYGQNMNFHAQLLTALGQPHAWKASQIVSADTMRVGYSGSLEEIQYRHIVTDHKDILAAIAREDFENAALILETHIQGAAIDEEIVKTKHPDYFVP